LQLILFDYFQLLCSGGVDSTVCAALLRVALPPNQVMAVHIDNGDDLLILD
jgi:7-cyano-7-deazaguanine synthase in queuosine biosynthesis